MRATAVLVSDGGGDKVLSPSVRMQSRGEERYLSKQRRQKAEVTVPSFGSNKYRVQGKEGSRIAERNDCLLLSASRFGSAHVTHRLDAPIDRPPPRGRATRGGCAAPALTLLFVSSKDTGDHLEPNKLKS